MRETIASLATLIFWNEPRIWILLRKDLVSLYRLATKRVILTYLLAQYECGLCFQS